MHLPIRRRLLRFAGSSLLLCFACPGKVVAALTSVSTKDAIAALKEALSRGANAAVAQLSAHDGFFGDARVRIPLPAEIQQGEKLIRRFGLGHYLDQLSETMNRAAESAVGEATPLLLDSLRRMTLTDAKTILGGPDDAATQYFHRTAGEPLRAKFLPIVEQATSKVALASLYDKLARRATRFGLLREADADLDDWIATRALDGLWLVLAEQEAAIRKDPAATGSALLKRVFGNLVKR